MTFDEAVAAYVTQFGENIPIYLFNGYSETELVAVVEKALRENKPIPADYEPGLDY